MRQEGGGQGAPVSGAVMDRRRWVDPHRTTHAISKYSVLSQPLGSRKEVSFSGFALMFSEIVQYSHLRVKSITAFEQRLSEIGFRVGRRALELVSVREKTGKRENKLIGILGFVMNQLWKTLFGKQLEILRKASSEACWYIEERDPLVNTYVSLPADFGSMNCAAFAAGVIAGVLDSAGFPAKVNAYFKELPDRPYKPLTFYYIDFEMHVIERENRMK